MSFEGAGYLMAKLNRKRFFGSQKTNHIAFNKSSIISIVDIWGLRNTACREG
jgi:hypothetical protein